MMTEKLVAVRRFRRGVVAALIALVLLLGAGASAAYVRTTTVETTCEKVNGVQAIVSGILTRSETIGLKHPHPGFSEAQIHSYYDRALKELAPATC